ncbi:MAG: hypothetical protein M3470_05435 [Chloroflexota bacterium]|nr:hypothetical protein [Chloroflexota bacterium]
MNNDNDEQSIIRPGQSGGGQSLQRVGFGITEVITQKETQGAALAARAQAEVQARYIMALQRPRNLMQTRVRLLEHCKRPGFAQVAEYSKPVGGQKIVGPSIRFVETALQEYSNCVPEETITYDDDWKRVTRVSVTDLERNVTYYGDVIVEKTVERRKTKDGDEVLGSRTNSYGDLVYKIRATEDDFANKSAAACSKKLRNLGLRILPADLVDEAMWVCSETRRNKDAQDPAAARRQLADVFAALRVMPVDLDVYLGHPFDQASPAELDELRAAYAAVRDGEAKWIDLVEVQRAIRGEVEKPSKAAEAAGDKLKAKIEQKKQQQRQPAAAVPAATPAPASAPAAKPAATTKPPAQAMPTAAPASKPELPPDEPPPLEGYEDRACAMRGCLIEVPATDPPGGQCYACANA